MKERKKNPFFVPGLVSCSIFLLLGLFLVVFGIIMQTQPEVFAKPGREPMSHGMVVSLLSLGLVATAGCATGIALIILGHLGKFDRRADRVSQWQSGTLTKAILFKDLLFRRKQTSIGFTVVSAVLIAINAFMYGISGSFSAFLIVPAAAMIAVAIWKWIIFARKPDISIVSDRIVSSDTEHDPLFMMDIPYFVFEKHGKYQINSAHIHNYYPPEALALQLETGEEVYVVYRKGSSNVLRIYRKKLWTLDPALHTYF